jgi:UDP-glucose 4-epimerase
MSDNNTVLVTGVSSYWGAQVAARLIAISATEAGPQMHIIGLDAEPPSSEIKGLDFVQADIRNPLLVDLLLSEEVDTVCHLAFIETIRPGEASFDYNVMGAMKLMGACSEADVRKIVLKSSMMVYGAQPQNPAFITEESPVQGSREYGYTRDMVEIEAFCDGFRRQVPDIVLTILRFSSIVGPNAETPMANFLKEPMAPILLGFDPQMQVIHEVDVVEALAHAVANDVPGIFNVAAEPILPLSKVIALASKIPVPVFHPFAYLGVGLKNALGLRRGRYAPIELDYIRYPWVGDLKNMHEGLGFEPRYTAEEALREFAGEQRLRRYMPESAAMSYDEERLRDTIERRRRAREREAAVTEESGEELR